MYPVVTMLCKVSATEFPCGKCKYDIHSGNIIYGTSILSISRIATKISWMDKFSNSSGADENPGYLYVTCAGSIRLCRSPRGINLSFAKKVCSLLFDNWYRYNDSKPAHSTYSIVSTKLLAISNAPSINEVRTILLSITKHLEKLTICTNNCTLICFNKEISNCKFQLSNTTTMKFLGLNDLIYILAKIVKEIEKLSESNFIINLATIHITCSGKIITDTKLSTCSQHLYITRTMCSHYLRTWIYATNASDSERQTIDNMIECMCNAKSVNGLYKYLLLLC